LGIINDEDLEKIKLEEKNKQDALKKGRDIFVERIKYAIDVFFEQLDLSFEDCVKYKLPRSIEKVSIFKWKKVYNILNFYIDQYKNYYYEVREYRGYSAYNGISYNYYFLNVTANKLYQEIKWINLDDYEINSYCPIRIRQTSRKSLVPALKKIIDIVFAVQYDEQGDVTAYDFTISNEKIRSTITEILKRDILSKITKK